MTHYTPADSDDIGIYTDIPRITDAIKVQGKGTRPEYRTTHIPYRAGTPEYWRSLKIIERMRVDNPDATYLDIPNESLIRKGLRAHG